MELTICEMVSLGFSAGQPGWYKTINYVNEVVCLRAMRWYVCAEAYTIGK